MAIHKFTRSTHRGETITMYGDGTSKRDYPYITDIIEGICLAIDHCTSYHIYNLGESKTIELRRLIGLISDCLGVKAQIERLPMQPGDVPITYADISRPQREIGYSPGVAVEEGVASFVRWYLEMARRPE